MSQSLQVSPVALGCRRQGISLFPRLQQLVPDSVSQSRLQFILVNVALPVQHEILEHPANSYNDSTACCRCSDFRICARIPSVLKLWLLSTGWEVLVDLRDWEIVSLEFSTGWKTMADFGMTECRNQARSSVLIGHKSDSV